jgi:hypothetical protein
MDFSLTFGLGIWRYEGFVIFPTQAFYIGAVHATWAITLMARKWRHIAIYPWAM